MTKHKRVMNEKFPHATDDLHIETDRNKSYSLYRFDSQGVTMYDHQTDNFKILHTRKSSLMSFREIIECDLSEWARL
jgi:hypothetical protein